MTGPEHYKAAEEALAILEVEREPDVWLEALRTGELALAIAAAQAHATLALAAGTALITDFNGSEQYAWHQVAGKAKP